MLKLEIVDDLASHLKRYSVRGLAAIAALQPVWAGLDAVVRDGVPGWLKLTVNSVLAIAVLGLALVKQPIAKEAFFEEPKGGGQ